MTKSFDSVELTFTTDDRPDFDRLDLNISEPLPSVGAPLRFFAPFLVRGERC